MSRLENEIAQTLADQIAREIDQELLDTLMIDILTKDGWTPTNINPAFGGSLAPKFDWYIETAEWVHLNARGDYKLLRGQWLFKDPRDATMFLLRWA